ncbi:MAG: PQQ-binding-like beta-propeller repeat protein [Planctomycetes bacterium]|nr:PQQ-binding-like beta-propeller repeat protein [Planctomycetota bacterium]
MNCLIPRRKTSFVAVGSSGEFAGLKATSRQILRDLSAEGRQAYETTFGPVARRELRNAIEAGDFDAVRRVAQRYFYTPAGYEAVLLLAAQEADMGRHFSAALAYQQLIDTPEAAKRFEPQLSLMAAFSWLAMDDRTRALELIEDLRSAGYRRLQIAGKEFRFDSLGERSLGAGLLDWLQETVGTPTVQAMMPEDQWLTFRGNAARNGQTGGGLPHMRVRWQARLLSHHKLETLHEDIAAELMRGQKSLLVAAAPLAVGNHIITRSAHGLIAIDFRTGKLVWQVEPQRVPEFERLVNASGRVASHEEGSQAETAKLFSTRIWEDHLYNSLSSDGERVYVIRDLSLPAANAYDAWAMPFMNGRRALDGSVGSNRLCAFDLATQGKLVWEIDGATAKDDFQGAFFLGSPLAVGKSLYCLVEMKSAVYLAAIDRDTGEQLWRQQLANLETGILLDSRRRLQASIPSYEGGILVCPTGAGVVVGVDLAKNALAWAYRYPTNRRPIPSFRARNDPRLLSKNQWIDSAATLANGHVLLTPPESDSLHCLDLVTGKLLWKLPRREYLFVAGVWQDRALLVGNKHLTAIRLEDGEPAWQEETQKGTLTIPENGVPTGRGFFSEGRYYLPLSTAEVVAIDMQQGVIVDRAVARDGQVLGNLVCYHGAVLSQNGQFLDRFDQIDVLRSKSEELLDEDPSNNEALRTLGEIAYNEGDLSQAIELLQQAYDSSPADMQTREVLAESLMIALDEDFASYRDRLPLLRELQEASGSGLLALLRLESHGLLEVEDPVGSFEACLQLYAESAETHELLSIGRHHRVDVSRWLRAQISEIWEKASESDREQISTRLEELVDQLPDQPSEGELRRLVDCMSPFEEVDTVAMRLAKEYASAGRHLEAQQLFLVLADSTSEAIRGEAVANCSLALHQLGLAPLARPFDEALQSTLASVVCLEGKTGKACLAEWGTGSVVTRPAWPYGKVEVTIASRQRIGTSTPNQGVAQNRISPRWGIRLEQCDDVLGRGSLMLSTTQGEVTAYDSLGNAFFRAALATPERGQRHDPSHLYAATRGNLLVVSLGRQLVAYDTLSLAGLGSTELRTAEPLWRKDVTSTLDTRYSQVRGRSGQDDRPGTFRASRSQRDGKWIGVIGPLTRDSCIYQDQRRLVCIDSLSGEVRWTRDDVPPGCDLYGDENYVFAVPRSSKNGMMFSTVDGRSLGQVSVPRWQEQLATIGRNVIRWRKRADGRSELSSFDSFSGKTLWREDFGRNARVDVAMSRYVSVVDQTGRCVLIDAVDGRLLVDQDLPRKPQATAVHLLVGSDRFVLAVQQKNSARRRGLNPVDFAMIDGLVYVFDRKTGLPSWKRPAEVRDQPLMLSQPVDAPVIAFVGNMARRNNRGSQQRISMLLLEKASGRLLFRDENLSASRSNYCSMKASGPEGQPEVVLETSSQTIRLAFTNKKRPPEPPALADVETKEKKGQKGLLGIGKKLIGGAVP